MLAPLPFLMLYVTLSYLLIREDIRCGILPDKFLCPLLWTGLLYHLNFHPSFLPAAVIGAVAGYLGFAFLYWGYRLIRKREGLGYGDIKYLAALGAWHGWSVLPMIALSSALFAAIYLLFRSWNSPGKRTLKNPLPFGPFMAAAGLLNGWQNLINFPL
ncbi:prepilin peptidase [Enterobacter sp. RHBSTW-00994]|uniref:prepilin peptidase n=1 Tax=Enterobacteriaceae TaxID=543 RepID=UPI0015E9DFF9|nr:MULTISPECIES: A24 family peptidase [Enterobacteriaceae]MBM3072807.1 prepilin peptidase [Lelliottia sp. RWM.1]QLR44987.1 prepilin peptidase [Enterobacter sp. RHBSTW-00994]